MWGDKRCQAVTLPRAALAGTQLFRLSGDKSRGLQLAGLAASGRGLRPWGI